MKVTKEFIVLRNKKSGKYLNEFKNNDGRLAFEVTVADNIQDALFLPEKNYKTQEDDMLALCEAFEAEPIRVKAEYTLETMDGEPAPEIVYDEKTEAKEKIKSMLGMLLGDDD